MSSIQELMGQTISSIKGMEEGSDYIVFELTDGRKFSMWHEQDCCESVSVEDVCGDVNDLIGSPIVRAEEPTNGDAPEVDSPESYTWTFYILGTVKGTVTIRWFGASNGYYSEGVSFEEVSAGSN
jgi:hypothetical protein